MIIDQAVGGTGAPNATKDVLRVKELFEVARYHTLASVPGVLGAGGQVCIDSSFRGIGDPFSSKMEEVIRSFQREVVGSKSPDGRIDPGGGTIDALVAEARKTVYMVDKESRQYSDPRVTMAIAGKGFPNIMKGNIQKPHLISESTISALRLLGYCCGLQQMKISEGIRSYEMMASYFLRKITSGSRGVRGEGYRLALKILKEHNGGKPFVKGSVPDEHTKTVADKMRKRCKETKTRVSLHVVSEDEYKKLNVVDLGYNSNPVLQAKSQARLFARMLDTFHANNPHAKYKFIRTYYPPHYMNAVLNSPYAREIRKEEAWHIEFLVANIPASII